MKGDFSRSTFRPDRPYSGVRMQQGRVPLDADWNEQVDIIDYVRRRAIVDIIGGCCIPDAEPNSFRVSAGGNGLRVEGGRAWVDGVLAERAAAQTVAFPEQNGRHVVYLEVFDRHVTAIEDPEIREVALGGPDTATRTETVCRARLAPLDGNAGCSSLRDFTPPGQTTGRLTASTGEQPADTPCIVPAAAGYARLENQLYRVEIQRGGGVGGAAPATFKWSRDNGSIAAPWLELDGNEIVIADPGRDDVLGFHDHRWLELSHDELDLAGEPGVVVEVIARRTGSDGRFRLEFDAHGQAVPDPASVGHPKVRRWDHDAGADVSTGSIPIMAANTAIAMEGGIEVRFSAGHYRAGDYWLIPARTFSGASIGDILWPRDGGGNALPQPPHGVARHFCTLAVVAQSASGGVQVLEDCRTTFAPLCGLDVGRGGGGCCTVTVGAAGGDVATIAEALARLPETGGQICILPGDYRERVVLDGHRDVTISGCGRRTRIVSSDGRPAFSLRNVENVTIRSLSVDALEGAAFDVEGAQTLTVAEVIVLARDRTAIAAVDLRGFELRDSTVACAPRDDARPGLRPVAVYLAGEDLAVTGNGIFAAGHDSVASRQAGGLQIGGGSERVLVRDNTIDGGCGPGIVLGSVSARPNRGPTFRGVFEDFVARAERDPARAARSTSLDEFTAFYAGLRRRPGATTLVDEPALGLVAALPTGGAVVSDGDLTAVRLHGNRVRNMGGSGVTVAHFFNLVSGDGDFISIHGLEIADNEIEDCLRMPQQRVTEGLESDLGLGGVALADVDDLVVRDNTIDRNASRVRTPACGLFVLHSLGLEVHRNRIRHNGMPPQESADNATGVMGQRGGIVVGYAEVPTRSVRLRPDGTAPRQRQDGTPAIRVHDNIVVSPEGRALEAFVLGPVSVQGNQLTALGADFRARSTRSPLGLDVPEGASLATFTAAFGGAVVLLYNLGVSNEVYGQLLGFAGLGLTGALPQPGEDQEDRPVLAGGNIQFVDNQVVLDALDGVSTFALSATTLLSLDDIACADNQHDCDLVTDIVGVSAMAIGFSVRMVANRFKEGILNAYYSAFTVGYLNTTLDNQGTHCFLRLGRQNPLPGENMVLQQLLPNGEGACGRVTGLQNTLRRTLFTD